MIWISWWLHVLLQACLLQAAVCLLQVSVMSESERGTSKLFKTSKIIKIGLEYKELEYIEDRKCFGKFRKYWCVENKKKGVHGIFQKPLIFVLNLPNFQWFLSFRGFNIFLWFFFCKKSERLFWTEKHCFRHDSRTFIFRVSVAKQGGHS